MRLLLEKGANIEATRIKDGRAELHAAAWFLQAEVVRLLLEKGASIHAVAKQAQTVLHSVKDSKQLIPNDNRCRKTTVVIHHSIWQKKVGIPKPSSSFFGISRNATSNHRGSTAPNEGSVKGSKAAA